MRLLRKGGLSASVLRRVAVLHGKEQLRAFYEHGVLDARLKSRTGYDQVGTSFGQMVGVLDSFLSNRQNEFCDLVHASSLESDVKHQLHFHQSLASLAHTRSATDDA